MKGGKTDFKEILITTIVPMKKLLVLTGGGDCPGLNAVIRAITKSALGSREWRVWGTIEAFNGILSEPPQLLELTPGKVAGIHVRGGTILKTTNKGNPVEFPVVQPDGSVKMVDRSEELIEKIRKNGFSAVVNIGGDGSQRISQALYEKGLNIVGVPKTIDNDLSATDLTFGFSTAVEIATESLDRLVTTAESHHRVMIMEVMGRDAGWIAIHTAIAGGAEICLIPEIPYDLEKVIAKIEKRYEKGQGFVNIVIAEGARPVNGHIIGKMAKEIGDKHIKLGGVGNYLQAAIEESGCQAQVRTTILGHVQRGGTPIAFDRVLATAFGVKAFELVNKGEFGRMTAFINNQITSVPISDAISQYNRLSSKHYLVQTARMVGISFGD
jgi:6-phosphofructokinase 1